MVRWEMNLFVINVLMSTLRKNRGDYDKCISIMGGIKYEDCKNVV